MSKFASYCAWAFLVITLLALTAWPALAQQRGYIPRACGFDMDDDGVIGEPDDDCNVCDGVTTDPDGDGVNEDLIYIDCDSGSNSTGNGTPGKPYKSIDFAWKQADGNGDGAEDILCFKGTCTTEKNVCPATQGVIGAPSRPHCNGTVCTHGRFGSEANDWQFSQNPSMLVGWDDDNDGRYWPVDSDGAGGQTKAVIDGSSVGTGSAFQNCHGASHVELAHFHVADYGRHIGPGKAGGFFSHEKGSGSLHNHSRHIYVHDVKLTGICQDQPKDGACVAIELRPAGFDNIQHFNLTNIDAQEIGSFFSRFGCDQFTTKNCGPFRYKNITYRSHGCNEGSCPSGFNTSQDEATTFIENWRFIRDFEIIDNDLAVSSAYRPAQTGFTAGVVLPECVQDWTIRNNKFRNFRMAIVAQPDDATSQNCDRRIERIVIDRNEIGFDSSSPDYNGDLGLYLDSGGSNSKDTVGSISVTNNFFWAASNRPVQSMVRIESGFSSGCGSNPIDGPFVFVGNTFHADAGDTVFKVVERGCNPKNITFKNNIISGVGSGDTNVKLEYAPSGWDASNNVYDSAGDFIWNNNETQSFSQWKNWSGDDGNSKVCDPNFVNSGSGDLHLSSSDSCARDAGTTVGAVAAIDIDAGLRPNGSAWDVGADEFGSEGDGIGDPGGGDPGGGDPGGGDPPPPPPPPPPTAPRLIDAIPVP